MDGYSLPGDSYYAGFSATQAPAPAAAPPPDLAPPPAPAPAPSSASAAYYGSYPPPSYGYLPPSAASWNSFPRPAVDPLPYPSGPFIPFDRTLAYGHHPFQPEPLPHPHSYPGPAHTFMPRPQRGGDAGRFRKKKPFPQHNLRPKNKPFKQTQQTSKEGGKAELQKTAHEGKKAGRVEPKAAKATLQGGPLVKDVQELHYMWRDGVDEVSGSLAGKKRKSEPQEKGEGKPATKDEGKTIGEKRARGGWKKARRKKYRKQGKDRRNRETNGDGNRSGPAEKVEKRRKVEAVPMTEEQMLEAEASLKLQRDARKSVHEFLYVPFEREDTQKIGRQDAQRSESGDADAQMVESGDAQKAGSGDAEAQMVEIVDAQNAGSGDAGVQMVECGDEQRSQSTDALESQKKNAQDLLNGGGSGDEGVQMVECGDAQQSQITDALESEKNNVQDLLNGGAQAPLNDDEQKTETNEQKPLGDDAQSFEKEHNLNQETLMPEELKVREEKGFEFFSKLLEDNKELRMLYMDKCNNGVFECLVCHSKMNKKFSNLVSLVTHASNVLKTKKLPEHRGYGRAVCSLLGWDPFRIPKVPRGKGSRSGVGKAPGDNESAPGDDANNNTTKQEVSLNVEKSEGEGGNLEASNMDAEGGNEQAQEAKVVDDAGDVQTDGDAIQDSVA